MPVLFLFLFGFLNDDVLGLIVFKSDLHDPSSSLASWKDDSSACSWNWVQCNPAIGRVTEINLAGLGLSGRIGKGLEKLQHLMTDLLKIAYQKFATTATTAQTLSTMAVGAKNMGNVKRQLVQLFEIWRLLM
ncbi:hypothetical protein HN51_001818 [Arachis hypogaea]